MKLMHDVAGEAQPGAPVAVLSGPTFAHEVAARLPAAVTLAVRDPALGERLRARIARPWFRPYLSDDVAGAEIGGAVKNVLAIACGVVEGRRLGRNARAALISRGFAEMTRFGLAKGARAETLAGLSGLGDLVLTCSSTSSRNFSLGKGLGEGRTPADLLADRRTVAEGAFTAPVLHRAALISRGFAEMTRFGLARGARAETLAGLSGLGDLVLTCSSVSSRNFSLGKGLGEGRTAADLLADRRTVAEGAFTAPVLLRAAREAAVDMPIVAAVCALLSGEAAVDEVVERLLSRPLRAEGV